MIDIQMWKQKIIQIRLMNKPSRFASKKLPINVYDLKIINKIKLSERYIMSTTLFREEKYNFHVGVDLKHKQEIIVATIPAIESAQQKPNKSMDSFCSQVISEEVRVLKKNKYKFKIFKKNGIFLEQFLRSRQLQLKHLYLLLSLFIELISKINKSKANIKSLNLQSLQLVENRESKQIMLEITNSTCLHARIMKSLSNKVQQNNKFLDLNKIQNISNARKTSLFTEQTNRKPSTKRDIEIAFEKMKEIASDYNISYENQVQKQQFSALIKYCALQVQKNQEKPIDSAANWLEMIEKVALKNNIDLVSVKAETKLEINKIKKQNSVKVIQLCLQLYKKPSIKECSDESDFSIQQDEEHYIDIRKGEIVDLVENHTFEAKIKQYFKSK